MITPEQEEMIDAVIDEAGNVANSFEWGSGSEKSRADLAEARNALEAELARLNADNARLRGLVKQAERASFHFVSYDDIAFNRCPFCGSPVETRHKDDCPAFTPDGVVR